MPQIHECAPNYQFITHSSPVLGSDMMCMPDDAKDLKVGAGKTSSPLQALSEPGSTTSPSTSDQSDVESLVPHSNNSPYISDGHNGSSLPSSGPGSPSLPHQSPRFSSD